MKETAEWELGRQVSYFNGSLRKLRLERGLCQKDVADALGLSMHAISCYETMRNIPSEATAKKIAKFFGVEVEQIFPKYLKMVNR